MGVEDRPLSKYYTKCPKCGPNRDHSDKDSLGVYKEGKYAYLRCYHSDQCEWNTPIRIQLEEGETNYEVIHKPNFIIPVPEGVVAPDEYPGVTIYQYKDIDGNLQGIVKRKDEQGRKVIRPFFYEKELGWMSSWPTEQKFLYGAHLLKNNEKPVLIVEGEKAANYGQKYLSDRFIVVTWPSGSSRTNLGDWDLLTGREIFIWPDNDVPGKKAAALIAPQLRSSKIKIFEVDHFGEGWDIADIEERLLDSEVNNLLDTAKTYTIAPDGSLTKKEFHTTLNQRLSDRRYGFLGMDKKTRPPGSGVVMFLGRTSHGKSLFFYNLMKKQLEQGNKVTLFSYEIPPSDAFIKLMMTYEHLPNKLEEGTYWGDYKDAVRDGKIKVEPFLLEKADQKQLSIVGPGYTSQTLLDEILKPGYYGSVIFIDYIQMIPTDNANSRYSEIKSICDQLNLAAIENNLLIITGAQVTMASSKGSPDFDQPREGKDIVNAATQVFKIWNKVKGASEGMDLYHATLPGSITLKVIKNRNGTIGKIYSFDLKNGAELVERL